MQIGGKDIVKYVCEYGVETKTFKMTQIQKYTFPCLLILEWAKQFKFGIMIFKKSKNWLFSVEIYCIA
jgi:hypothetical protein